MSFWKHVHGKIKYSLTNDYLVRVMLQNNRRVLEAIISSMLDVQPEEIRPVIIQNPIMPGEAIDEKEYVMDIHTILRESMAVNIEIQVINYDDWPERSLQYLCRAFDVLHKGEDYINSRTAIHIGILDFNLFKDDPGFFSSYRLMNEETNKIYTEKFQLYTMCLPNVLNATEKDISLHRDVWAKYFKAKTWEELRTMAKAYPVIEEAASEVYKCIQDEAIRLRIEARQDYERRQRTLLSEISSQKEQISSQKEQISSQKEQLADMARQIDELKKQLADHKDGGPDAE